VVIGEKMMYSTLRGPLSPPGGGRIKIYIMMPQTNQVSHKAEQRFQVSSIYPSCIAPNLAST
jgi:hypothetical protein